MKFPTENLSFVYKPTRN